MGGKEACVLTSLALWGRVYICNVPGKRGGVFVHFFMDFFEDFPVFLRIFTSIFDSCMAVTWFQ